MQAHYILMTYLIKKLFSTNFADLLDPAPENLLTLYVPGKQARWSVWYQSNYDAYFQACERNYHSLDFRPLSCS